MYMDRLYLLVLPTKIERSMWLYSLKNMRKELYQDKDEEFKRVNVEYFTVETQKSSDSSKDQIHIPISNKKSLESTMPKYYNLRQINQQISELSTSYYASHTRPPIDFGELKNLHDEEATAEKNLLLKTRINPEKIFGFDNIHKDLEKEKGREAMLMLSPEQGSKKMEPISFDLKEEQISFNFNGSSI
jgi:hypothetical protein